MADVGPAPSRPRAAPASRRTCRRRRACSSCSRPGAAARSTEERREIWDEILAIYSAQVYSIGLIGGILQPVAARQTLRNVPEEAIFNWEPGAQFGIYRPDTFWFDGKG